MYLEQEGAFLTGKYRKMYGNKKQSKKHWKKTHYAKIVQILSIIWSIFSCIRTKYGDLRSKSAYSTLIQENTDQKNSVFGHFSHSVWKSID